MLIRSFRRSILRNRFRSILLAGVVFLLLDALIISGSHPRPSRTSTLSPALAREKIFIVSIQRSSEYMLRLYWNAALLSLVSFLGPENVFVSIVESGSRDDTKGALLDLESELTKLGVESKVVLGEDVYAQMAGLLDVPKDEDKKGWIYTGLGEEGWQKRRIPHLAELRNTAMEPLLALNDDSKRTYDKILWINDVVFTNEDIATLLSTREGNYAAACSLDFSSSADSYYDTFALRDFFGLKTGTASFPYFTTRVSREALLSLQPVPVKSCWNGIAAFDASPFYSLPSSEVSSSESQHQTTRLQFRGIPDSLAASHVEGSECCLIHADNYRLRAEKGVWLNPNVRVTFNASTYPLVNPQGPLPASITSDEELMAHVASRRAKEGRDSMLWPSPREMWRGRWKNRAARWWVGLSFWSENMVVRRRVESWIAKGKRSGEIREELGIECLVNEMQVLLQNGWLHV
ncbi:uncharacterized protein BP5553_02915 [Venustampulla echinocandica]|uniref:Glycosyltransferase family 69 protein n=1 Tax=Venustampulla echinocandica TaxID=2656787 RepID=A0A370TSQ9_9HELO|nr:uncharacterized protein BP5553_02915 [Venustampulla echinocandica]RDL38575.1 hypothetical protein BP5553_02915 [Venustampulla echinocandica]